MFLVAFDFMFSSSLSFVFPAAMTGAVMVAVATVLTALGGVFGIIIRGPSVLAFRIQGIADHHYHSKSRV